MPDYRHAFRSHAVKAFWPLALSTTSTPVRIALLSAFHTMRQTLTCEQQHVYAGFGGSEQKEPSNF